MGKKADSILDEWDDNQVRMDVEEKEIRRKRKK